MVIEGEGFSFLGDCRRGVFSCAGLLVAVWVELIVHNLGVLSRRSGDREVLALRRRVVH